MNIPALPTHIVALEALCLSFSGGQSTLNPVWTDPYRNRTQGHVCPTKTPISLCLSSFWSKTIRDDYETEATHTENMGWRLQPYRLHGSQRWCEADISERVLRHTTVQMLMKLIHFELCQAKMRLNVFARSKSSSETAQIGSFAQSWS